LTKRKAEHTDPHQGREAQNYENPIPSREYITEVLEQAAGPMTHEALCDELELVDEDSIEALRRRLIAMSRDGQLLSNRKRGYGVIDKMDLVRGYVQGHKDGFGFLISTDGSGDLYLSYREMRRVMSGDEVLVRETGKDFKGRREGSIVEVLAHNTHQVVGRYEREGGIHFVRPDNARISHEVMLAAEDVGEAKSGQFVSVEIISQPGRRKPPTGRVLEVLGDHMAPGMEIDVAIRSHGIPHLWPRDVSDEGNALPVEVSEADKSGRVDLRQLPFVTIDGEDARDFDDAVYCEAKASGGWRLFVAIADVSHYVQLGSALDREAQVRGNSVYFPDHVVPMLPESLSNGLCSLNPNVDRLCMVCEMTISESGSVSGYKFSEGIIHSHARLTYTQVGQALDNTEVKVSGVAKFLSKILPKALQPKPAADAVREQLADVMPHLEQLHRLYKALRVARTERGAIDFDTVETRILFDENRKISEIVPTIRNDAHKLIEECMLAANVCAARFLERHELPALYRVHEGPKAEKLENLRSFLGELGLSLPGGEKPEPGHYQALLQSIEERPDHHLIQTVMLRSLSQAKYQPDNDGHFGLGYDAYAHFTSPIRRYPDLLVHRALRRVIRSDIQTRSVKRVAGVEPLNKQNIYPYSVGDMVAMGEQASVTERRADEATRDVTSWLKCEFLQDHVGDEFPGVVSAVTSFGLFVELKDLYVEGLIHITGLPKDYYHFDAAQHRLVGERTRQMFRLGDELVVQVAGVNLDDRKVDFELVETKTNKRKKHKVSATAKKLAAQHEDERTRKQGNKNRGKKAGSEKPSGSGRTRSAKKTGSENPANKGSSNKRRPSKGNKARTAKSAKQSKPKRR